MAYPDNEELKKLLKESQLDHKNNVEGDTKLIKNDQERIKQLLEFMRADQIRSANDFLIASYLFQYGQTVAELEEALKFAIKSVELGIPPHESLVPQTLDKLMIIKQIRVGIHKSLAKQKFGTQLALWMDGGKNITFCPLDGTVTPEELAAYGLPDCRKYEGKPYKNYVDALSETKKKAAQVWQASHK